MMRARFACGCMMPTHCWVRSLRLTLAKLRSSLPGLDPGQIEQIVEHRNQMRAGSVDVLDIFAVALVADRAEALGHDHFGKAGHGIERRADFVADLGEEFRLGRCRAQRLALGVAQLVLVLLAAGDVAEYRADAVAADTGQASWPAARAALRPRVPRRRARYWRCRCRAPCGRGSRAPRVRSRAPADRRASGRQARLPRRRTAPQRGHWRRRRGLRGRA